MREELLVFFVVALTSVVVYRIGRNFSGSRASAAKVTRALFECIGAFVLFLCMNLALEVTVVFLSRYVLKHFVGFYRIADIVLFALSACQAIAFRLWWRSQ